MMHTSNRIVDDYLKWLTSHITETRLGDGLREIATPFLDRFNDGIVIYAKETSDGYLFSDDCALTNNTIAIGDYPAPKKLEALRTFLRPYNIQVADNGELQMTTSRQNYPIRMNLFLQAIMSANDMFAPRPHSSEFNRIFMDEIVSFFDKSNVAYSQNVKIEGQSGIIHQIGFILPKYKKMPERFIYALNKPTKQNVELSLFAWNDIQILRGSGSRMITFLNDENNKISDNLLNAFTAYNALPIPWSKREDHLEQLAV